MLFSSNVFLYVYLPVVLALYYLSPRKLKNLTLFVVSLFFYGWGEPVYVLLMASVIMLDYACGIWMEACRRREKSAKPVLIFGVIVNLLILGWFKYAGFLMDSMKVLVPELSAVKLPDISLPIGISFYVFQSMSYIIDVYRDDAPVQKNAVVFGAYVTLFPQLIAGPIVRYTDVAEQLVSRREKLTDVASGIRMFVIGLAKKILLANQMGALWMELQTLPGTLTAWVGIAAYTLQIYFDFSGYSDMARGLGRMIGFEFLPNFNYPYISESITDFWRRWHISLSTWFREYVYIPLGGNRRGTARQILNLVIVWSLTGLWHGASWNFLLWGLYYCLLLSAEKLGLLRLLRRVPKFLRRGYTLLAVMLGWALFYFEDMATLGLFLRQLFTASAVTAVGMNRILAYLPLMAVSMLAATPAGAVCAEKLKKYAWSQWVFIGIGAAMLLLCVGTLVSQSYNPFIYFRF